MKVIKSEDGYVYNFIHDNGMQTSVKVSPSGSFTPEQLDRDTPITLDKNKYSVIISSSLGCQMSCSFCHLTKNNKPFHEINKDTIVNNVIEALRETSKHVDIGSKYIKLCFMGEGEPILDMDKTSLVTRQVLLKVFDEELAIGLDGVDISTCMPNIAKNKMQEVNKLNELLNSWDLKLNPYNYNDKDRTIVRLFYSLHHYSQHERDKIIPNTTPIYRALSLLSMLDVNVVVHYMFMDGVNDSERDVKDLVSFINGHPNFQDYEFRVLRYNSHGDIDVESSKMYDIISHVSKGLFVKRFKVQYSAGEEVKAACGMFI